MLSGCGFGLTPSGDDFIVGLLIGLNFIQKMHGRDLCQTIEAVSETAKSENIFSNLFLKPAKEGRLQERMKNLLAALISAPKNEIYRHTEHLLSVGESSGADLATGFFLTVRSEWRNF